MNNLILYSGFLYFPEDKSAYLPAVIEMILLLLLCIGVFYMFRRISKKQELKAKELEERILRKRQQNISNKTEH